MLFNSEMGRAQFVLLSPSLVLTSRDCGLLISNPSHPAQPAWPGWLPGNQNHPDAGLSFIGFLARFSEIDIIYVMEIED